MWPAKLRGRVSRSEYMLALHHQVSLSAHEDIPGSTFHCHSLPLPSCVPFSTFGSILTFLPFRSRSSRVTAGSFHE